MLVTRNLFSRLENAVFWTTSPLILSTIHTVMHSLVEKVGPKGVENGFSLENVRFKLGDD